MELNKGYISYAAQDNGEKDISGLSGSSKMQTSYKSPVQMQTAHAD